jgi:hypothetical protein
VRRAYPEVTVIDWKDVNRYPETCLWFSLRNKPADMVQKTRIQLELQVRDRYEVISKIRTDEVNAGWYLRDTPERRIALDTALKDLESKASPLLH